MGTIVPMFGGPLDGQEKYRELSTSRHERFVCYVDGYPTGKSAPVHVYEAHGSPHAPFHYTGVWPRAEGDSPYPLSAYLKKEPTRGEG